jgi:hypothetical protein
MKKLSIQEQKFKKKNLQDHDDVLLLKVDKQADLLFMLKTDYYAK